MLRVLSVFKPRRLLHIDLLGQESMEESVAHINLTESPSAGHSERENQAHRSRLHNWTESVAIINTMLL
jgi:hypothetical protein